MVISRRAEVEEELYIMWERLNLGTNHKSSPFHPLPSILGQHGRPEIKMCLHFYTADLFV